ncbi:alpha-1,3-mannosyl-glycoprotein 4-beta-N-acetylglucosaminyltransferase-like protein MGAT4E [Dasypus novemcinctus]|uniref:alpha-1,3-mannosyl-glycoprotein 4-beta-N-acetylglucosaminyltransferase-like protein MGAT4E n=1 Tax=Dasypus novemcinctus TaxID=9361 RepID=UPI00265D615A|nr:alpha-1,3-mannosyl-glycoprotein 4-beta-N-acetylglucosaminyltransferase-like protein MGAT4E [Dasypus novemcinctus]
MYELHPTPGIMHHYLWRHIIAIASLVCLSLFLFEKIQDIEYNSSWEEKRMVWQLHLEQMKSERNHLRTFKKMQKNSSLLQHAYYEFLAGTIPQEKKLLTVGIYSVHSPHGNHLLDTLQSLFQVSSEDELKYITVLVYLSDPDLERLSQTVTNISSLFKQHIEDKKLLVIHGLLKGSPLPGYLNNISHSSSCEVLRFRQKVDYALLMNFASKLSEYFLMIGDNVHCSPKFVSAIYWALSAWKEIPWVILEFSNLSFSGKVIHTSDLSRLITFFFLFPKDTPDLLLSNFGFLLGQTVPIRFIPKLFYSWDNYSTSEDTCNQEEEGKEEEEDFGKPNNPPAKIYTNMMMRSSHLPAHAYFLNESYFLTEYPIPGNKLTLIFDQPLKVIRVQVLTGFGRQGLYRLEQAQVELGSEPIQEEGCTSYILLGPLVKGILDQKVFYKEDSVGAVRCVQLLVTAAQKSNACIRMIKIWIKTEKG